MSALLLLFITVNRSSQWQKGDNECLGNTCKCLFNRYRLSLERIWPAEMQRGYKKHAAQCSVWMGSETRMRNFSFWIRFVRYSVLNGGLDLPAGCMIMKLAFDLLHNYIFRISKWRWQHVCYLFVLFSLLYRSLKQRQYHENKLPTATCSGAFQSK